MFISYPPSIWSFFLNHHSSRNKLKWFKGCSDDWESYRTCNRPLMSPHLHSKANIPADGRNRRVESSHQHLPLMLLFEMFRFWSITMTYQYTSIRTVKIKNSDNNKYWWGSEETIFLMYCWLPCEMLQLLWKVYSLTMS